MAAHLGVGQRFLPRQAAQGPMVAPVAWQLDVWGLQSIHWQGHANTGKLPVLILHRPQSASDQQPLVHDALCAFAIGLLMIYAAMTISMSCQL